MRSGSEFVNVNVVRHRVGKKTIWIGVAILVRVGVRVAQKTTLNSSQAATAESLPYFAVCGRVSAEQ